VPDDVAGGAGWRYIAIDAGSAYAAELVKLPTQMAAEIDLSQALCMAVLLDVVLRQHPCRRRGVL
jgi:hypothetical protein